MALFHNLRLIARQKKPNYVEPAVGWNDEDFHTGVTKFGVANYEGTATLKVMAPAERPALMPPPQTEAMEVEPLSHGTSISAFYTHTVYDP